MAIQGNRNVLIIASQPHATEYWQKHVAIAGFNPIVAKTGAGAILKIEERVPDLILLDTGLSDMDGVGVIRFVRAERRTWDTPVIAISGLPHMKDRCIQAGADLFLLKPFRILDLVVGMKKLLRAPALSKAH
jgi:DNA-binding response OmpR family regulator